MPKKPWYNLSVEETFKLLKSSRKGLGSKEVQKRLKKSGLNKLPEEKEVSKFLLLVNQFKSILVYILLIAAVISFFLGELIDMYVILAAVILNVMVGFFQENKAQRAIAKLKKIITPRAVVIRDNKEKIIEAQYLVPGDVILLSAGVKIPADARLFEINDFQINEAPLTGESYPVRKKVEKVTRGFHIADRKNLVYMGTIVTSGIAKAVVLSTGLDTEIGQVAFLIKETKEDKTPLQKKIGFFSKWLGVVILGICLIILVGGIVSGRTFGEMFGVSVAVAVAAIPEGLMVAMTVILAIGMQRILKKRALVRKLIAAETLGSTTVICTDKTGTLTEGDMRVVKLVTYDHDFILDHKKGAPKISREESLEFMLALKIGVLCNDAHIEKEDGEPGSWIVSGNPTEKALFLAGAQVGLRRKNLEEETPRLDEVPFDSEKKYMLTLNKLSAKENIFYLKGAPEKILEMSSSLKVGGVHKKLTLVLKEKLIQRYETLSRQGLRVIALGYKRVKKEIISLKNYKLPPQEMVFLGLIGIADPLREEVKETVKLCKASGIKIVMITGDNRLTAQAIAQKLGLKASGENILEGEQLEKLSDDDLKKQVKDITIYARVSPKDKLRIVDAWQARGEVVAMTGDGVNDAPALKSADIGVALGSGTDVAQEVSDIVILDDNFSTIVSAVEQGRVIFDNIRKVTLYLLSDSFSEVLIILGGLLFQLPLPLLAAQILWINLLTDGFPSIALTVEPKEKEVMEESPRGAKDPILNLEMKWLIFIISLVTGVGTLLLFYFIWKTSGDLERARTAAFATLGIDSLLYVFSVRSLRKTIFQKDLFSNRYLILAVIGGIILQLVAIYIPFFQKALRTVPLGFFDWSIILLVCLMVILTIESIKYIFSHRRQKAKQ